jgi:transposase-like protein
LGKRYTEEEKQRIKELANQGYTDKSIAKQLGRSTNAIRNHRHRNNFRTRETKTIQQLKQQTLKLERKRMKLEQRIGLLSKTRQIEEDKFRNRLQSELTRLKNRKPKLFQITEQEQLAKLTVQLATSIINWLIE